MKNKDIYKKSVRYLIDNRFAIQERPSEFTISPHLQRRGRLIFKKALRFSKSEQAVSQLTQICDSQSKRTYPFLLVSSKRCKIHICSVSGNDSLILHFTIVHLMRALCIDEWKRDEGDDKKKREKKIQVRFLQATWAMWSSDTATST